MFTKVAVCFACVVVFTAQAQYYPAAYPTATVVHTPAAVYHPVNSNPSYSYKYGVSDPSTGDYKTAEESLSNGIVQGQYSLAESDGSVRTVSYTADDVNGFVAHVSKGAKVIAAPAAPSPVYAPAVPAPVYASAVPATVYAPAPVYASTAYHPATTVYHAATPVSYPFPYKRQA